MNTNAHCTRVPMPGVVQLSALPAWQLARLETLYYRTRDHKDATPTDRFRAGIAVENLHAALMVKAMQ